MGIDRMRANGGQEFSAARNNAMLSNGFIIPKIQSRRSGVAPRAFMYAQEIRYRRLYSSVHANGREVFPRNAIQSITLH